ncbi:MAG: D-tyrosyl-tRNA(Tyr) deacylase [Ignavibacteriales bacterium]|nr:D-tyrosyl-tRNA(Tyr) deacylase [Ignavibacteriales bacterium]
MRAVVQRVSEAGVFVEEENYRAEIGEGVAILLGVREDDVPADADFVADKCRNLRIFEDAEGKMNRSLEDVGGAALVVSQFTLYGATAKGNRPSFTAAAKPDVAVPLYERFVDRLRAALGADNVKTGVFGATMDVKLVNAGPVTLLVESKPKTDK